jgi:beta-galactosidase/beta-glucuronidase
MEYVSPLNIDYIKLTPEYDKQEIHIEVDTNKSERKVDTFATAEISFKGTLINKVSAKVIDGKAKIHASVLDKGDPWSMKRWYPHDPNLYDLVVTLSQDDEIIDEVNSYFGMRKISIQGHKILLNNEPLYQRLILDQGYWEESDLTPPSVEALELDIDRIFELGYNGLRKHQKIEDNRFLYLCDKKGMLVWSEVGSTYSFNDTANKKFTEEWMEIVRQNYNHPSIITWVPFNESWGINDILNDSKQQQYTEAIYHLTKTFDPYRPIVTNDGWEHTISDIITLHDYEEFGDRLFDRYKDKERLLSNEIQHDNNRYPFANGYVYKGQPVIISEFGGIAFNNGQGWGYGNQVTSKEAFMDRFDKIHKAIQDLDYVTGYCYTQLTDVQQEVNGLLTMDREFKDNIDLEQVRRINTRRTR